MIVTKSKKEKKKERNEKRDKKGSKIGHMTERKRRVAAFLSKAECINETALM